MRDVFFRILLKIPKKFTEICLQIKDFIVKNIVESRTRTIAVSGCEILFCGGISVMKLDVKDYERKMQKREEDFAAEIEKMVNNK